MEVVGGDLLVLDDAADHELVDAVGDGFLLVLGLPEEAVLLDGHDLLEELVQVSLRFVRLDFPQNQRLGDGAFLDLLRFLSVLLGLLKKLLGLLLIINKEPTK